MLLRQYFIFSLHSVAPCYKSARWSMCSLAIATVALATAQPPAASSEKDLFSSCCCCCAATWKCENGFPYLLLWNYHCRFPAFWSDFGPPGKSKPQPELSAPRRTEFRSQLRASVLENIIIHTGAERNVWCLERIYKGEKASALSLSGSLCISSWLRFINPGWIF